MSSIAASASIACNASCVMRTDVESVFFPCTSRKPKSSASCISSTPITQYPYCELRLRYLDSRRYADTGASLPQESPLSSSFELAVCFLSQASQQLLLTHQEQ